MSKKITVLALVSDKTTITLYHDDGDTTVLPSNEYETQKIVEYVMPFIAANRKVTIEIDDYKIYQKFEEKSKGRVSFFRMAKDAVKSIFAISEKSEKKVPVQHMTPKEIESTYGIKGSEPIEAKPVVDVAPTINRHITPDEVRSTGSKHIPKKLQETDTVVAVVGTGDDARVIPHMENIANQIANTTEGSEEGVIRFLERIAKVIDNRGHSIEDLLKFLKNADLPIADDGSVIAYKMLRRKDDAYVDCHTKKVVQRVGSHVFMDPALVDPSRTQDCSNGLHIARRDYLGSFSGDVIVICKINPEDFIAVPQYSPSKVRVCGYHILAELSQQAYNQLKNNHAMTSEDDASILLGNIIKGNHIGVIETVEIKGHKGTNVLITPVVIDSAPPLLTPAKAQALNTHSEAVKTIAPLTPKQIREQAKALSGETQSKVEPVKETKEIPLTKAQQARKLFENAKFKELAAFKKHSKKSYESLGFNQTEQTLIKEKTQ